MSNPDRINPTTSDAIRSEADGIDRDFENPSSNDPSPTSRPTPWPKIDSRRGDHMVLFRPRWDRLRNPRTGEEFDRLVLETPDWVNVVAITRDQRLVCVHQFRFGTGTVTLEVPGGMVDRGEGHEQAARRELQEETGFTSARWRYLGAIEPNPAFQDNLCHHWLAEECALTHELALDSGEDIQVELVPIQDVVQRIAAGDIRHSLVISALSHVLDLRTVRDPGAVTSARRPD
jgi:8-oxo-dGTP pyrophosphatase MutT (NUDIX family)